MGELEEALTLTERDARATHRAAETAAKAAKRLVAATQTGDSAAIARAIDETEQATSALSMQLANTRQGWSFDVKAYSDDGSLFEELRDAFKADGLPVHEQDARLFCYPSLVRVTPDGAVEIDRKRFRTVRPSYVLRQLKLLRSRPQRFSPERFSEVLFACYEWARRTQSGQAPRLAGRGPVLELVTLFDLLTIFPDTKKDYSRAEFTRDLYLLDRSLKVETRAGARLEFSASTGTKGSASRILTIIGEDGYPKVYYGISFTAPSS